MRNRRLLPFSSANWLAVGATSLFLLLLAGCGEDETPAFNRDNKEGFMTACVVPATDSDLMTAVCGCVIEELKSYDFGRFESLDAALGEDPEAELPTSVIDATADCFIEAAEL